MSDRVVIAHGHMFKNAGTTLDWALQRNFGEAFVDHRDGGPMRREGAAYLGPYLAERPWIEALSSHHLCYPMPELPGTTFFLLYLLRHPVERVLSVYNFERRQNTDTPGARNAKRHDLAGYVDWRLEPEAGPTIRDFQTRFLAGRHRPARRPMDDEGYAVALDTLERVALVGIVERFDESMVVFEHGLRAAFPDIDLAYVRQNVSDRSGRSQASKIEEVADRLGEERYQRLLANNRYDLALYEAAQRRLDRHLDDVDDLAAARADFTARREALATSVKASAAG